MSMQTVNLDTYSLSLLTAKEDILNTRSSTNWALFTYAGVSNKLKLADSGVGGVAELAEKFNVSKAQYGLCRVGSAETGGHRIAMIFWVGQNVDDYRRTECASHIPAIKNFFKEAHAFIRAEKVEDVTEENIKGELSKTQAQAPSQWVRRSSRSVEKEDIVGTNYRKTNAAMEMRLINRDSFWARAEREEEQRKEEERRRASEERRRLERERILKDRKDAEERDRKMNEKLQMIEEQRRKQAEKEEALRREEKLRWKQQQREHEEDMRARLRRSESIEKAAEAAVLVSQRSMNPREFFRQLSSTSQSPTSPGSSRSGKPFRRYQRSLTDTAFIFSKTEESTASSPSSPLVSPFSRASPSPFCRSASPPISPDFRPVTSPQRPRAPMSPPTSPLRSAPQLSALPVVPPPNHQVQPADEPRAPSPTEPSAPPASPNLLASMSSSYEKNNPSQSHLDDLPVLPPNTPTEPEPTTFCFEPGLTPQAPTAPLPERPQPNTELHTAPHVHTELVSDTGYKVQAVLIEEEEEEEEDEVEVNEEEKVRTQPQHCVFTTEPVQTEVEEQEQAEEKYDQVEEQEQEQVEKKYDQVEEKYDQVEKYNQVVEQEQVEEQFDQVEEEYDQVEEEYDQVEEETNEQKVEEKDVQQQEEEVLEEGSKQDTEHASLKELVEVQQEEEKEAKEERELIDQSEDSWALAQPAELSEKEKEPAIKDVEPIGQEIKHEVVIPSTNGITNGDDTQEQNGIERSLSPSDTELSSPELAVCYDLHGTAEDDDINEDKEQEISQNGQEVLAERQICVRALYDYQAEDESEISFEPGDIIRDVETVDKAWWRGWSKDGRQGLFPANYVETI
ncbi:drebrin-like protein A isoform X3 [Scomber japonicus]|uniref:drebrin-like protein A isoform X3 n=1 Tax=Scomber japonicus TaxID=13676 RepID=UPI0023059222|nr:drebrin-like protein A isoform X3 [Scomber japonicus]